MRPQQATHEFNGHEQDFAVLPGTMQRGELEGLIVDVARHIGMSDSLLKSLQIMMRETRPSDWTDPTKEPICFAMQSNIAFLLGKTDRSVRRDEAELEHRFGFIRKEVAANGNRCRFVMHNGDEFRQGISFTPLIEAVPQLLAIREGLQDDRRQSMVLKRKCSALKRNVKNTLMELQSLFPDHAGVKEITQAFLSWPTRYTGFTTIDALDAHYYEVLEVSDSVDKLKETLQCKPNMSGPPDTRVRPYIQDTTQEPYVSCNDPVSKRTDCKQSDTNSTDAEPIGSTKECLENKHGGAEVENNSEFLAKMTPQRLFALSSEEMKLYISHHQGDRDHPTAMDFVQASIDRLAELGINRSAYNAAIEQMGDMATALCILIIDRNRFHPETPIKNPGGVLRAMTQRHVAGKLNIVGSLIGLSERERAGDA